MSDDFEILLLGEQAMVEFGVRLGKLLPDSSLIFLEGDLGAGKTTLSRGILAAFGHQGVVKSPTYTLVEPYTLGERLIYHFDLYRLGDPEELEFIGIRDYLNQASCCLIEWPERGEGILPEPDLRVEINVVDDARRVAISAGTNKGQEILGELTAQ